MKTVFFGTPEYVIPILKKLSKFYDVEAVVTQRPKPVGRKGQLKYSAVDTFAHKRNIKIIFDLEEVLKIDAEFAILASFGKIIPKNIINHFPKGIINIHPSDLPEFRGASPVQATILTGKKEAVVSIMMLDEKMDHGAILTKFKSEIEDSDTTKSLRDRLFEKSADVLIEMLPNYFKGKVVPKKQDHTKATFTKELTKKDGFIPPEILSSCMSGNDLKDKKWKIGFLDDYELNPSTENLDRFIRAMNPWPIAWTFIKTDKNSQKKRLKIISAKIENDKLVLEKIQLEGKNEVVWDQFKSGYPDFEF